MEAGERQLVMAAQAGDPAARDQLMVHSLPLVYNVVGRALDGRDDVDDVVQDTLLRALRGLGGLREPERFRGWLVTIAMNQVRRRWTAPDRARAVALESVPEPADPDFAETAITRLGLSEQRQELAEATRWLEEADRDLLALWWLEASGELTRAELAEALEVSPAHAAVRVHRLKDHLDVARSVVAALATAGVCAELEQLTAGWDGRPAPVWRKRFARHIRSCQACGGRRGALRPAETLLAGMLLVPPPPQLTVPVRPVSAAHALPSGRGALVPAVAAGTLLVAALIWVLRPDDPPPAAAPAVTSAPTAVTPSPTSVETPPRLLRRSAPPPPTRAATPADEVVRLVNAERSKKGCRPVTTDPRLTRSAQAHSAEMARRREMTHTGANGSSPGDRISAQGYRWGAWSENVAVGAPAPSGVMTMWMNSPGHRANILNCAYTQVGVGIASGDGKLWWTQNFATPA
ncbi:sigma-70 family RNA polymerase sigma factor [Actinocorallia longicatena]|uniref:RNA polymerase sigma factor (Sigma-70 family) n=1 Tax=Actinocorallia longicatena TaxID=111803 RepID=A0ABP6Q5P5_9ACTN